MLLKPPTSKPGGPAEVSNDLVFSLLIHQTGECDIMLLHDNSDL